MIFVDGSNLFWGVKRHNRGLLDYSKLKDALLNGRNLVRPYYYGSIDSKNPQTYRKQKGFHDALDRDGWHTEVKPLRERYGKKVEKGADVALAIDMVSMALRDNYDIAILVSGDDDFQKAVDEVKRAGKRIEIAYFESQIAAELRKAGDKFIDLVLIWNSIKQN